MADDMTLADDETLADENDVGVEVHQREEETFNAQLMCIVNCETFIAQRGSVEGSEKVTMVVHEGMRKDGVEIRRMGLGFTGAEMKNALRK